MTDLSFEWQIDEFLFYCQSKQLRPKTTQSYEQALRLFARWCSEERKIETVDKVKEADIRRYIMKRLTILVLAVILVVFSNSAFASSCPLPAVNADAEICFSGFVWYRLFYSLWLYANVALGDG